MHPLLNDHYEALRQLCQKHRVRRLELFGSATGPRFNPQTSDLDFLVEFEPMPPLEHGAAFWAMRDDLRELFGRPIDLVETKVMKNPYMLESINETRVLLYAA